MVMTIIKDHILIAVIYCPLAPKRLNLKDLRSNIFKFRFDELKSKISKKKTINFRYILG